MQKMKKKILKATTLLKIPASIIRDVLVRMKMKLDITQEILALNQNQVKRLG